MPSFSLGLGLGLTQEFQEGDESSEDEHMKEEIKDEKLDEGESYDSEETECDNNILRIEDDEDKKREVGKILNKPSLKLSSPYNKKKTEEPAVDVIDNWNSSAKFSRAYRDAPNELKILFRRYLMRVNHKSALTLEGVEPERVNMNWRTRDNHVDYGVFCMHHMKTYMGDKTIN
ncbi:unnamed protein product [Lactuca saligna]|uniref:Uncharacterized protein n=1 Tax=Lactuca saligna TaxID=75948 RepID=A0AA36E6N0_LACSI|nr:unnamed protein product [Lactuca saligna]